MRIALGIVAVVVGAVGFLGQLVSAIDFSLGQRLGFQEGDEHTDSLYRRLEHNTARWDVAVLWTMPVAGVLMLMGHGWWPATELLAGAIALDTGGREATKILGLRSHGVRVGSDRDARIGQAVLVTLAAVGLVLAVHAVTVIV